MNRFAFLLITVLSFAGMPTLIARQADKPTTEVAAAPVNLNTASATDLATLPGIGMKTAELIVQYRTKNGPFKKVEEIMNIRGIGEKSFLKLKSRIAVTPPKAEKAESN